MTIFLDPQIFYLQKFGGISRIFAEFWNICNQRDDVTIVCPLYYSDNLHLREYNLQPKRFSFLYDRDYAGKKYVNAIQKRVNKYKANYALKNTRYDVFICSYYDPYFVSNLKGKPFVLTVFDMIHEIFPNYFSGEIALMQNKRILCEKSSKIVAISASTKKDILQFYSSISFDKVNVIHLSQSIDTKQKIQLNWLPKQYVLFIGKRELYKQFDTLLQAMMPVFKTNNNIKIVCAGGGALNAVEIANLQSLNLLDKVVQNNFYDNELFSIYSNAAMFVFPSEYEGFGIPAIEAMVCGCPVILSNTSSLPEIGEAAASYFEPNNMAQLTTCITTILEDETYKNNLITKGYEQAKKFSWHKMTNEYLETVKEILEH